MIVSDSTKFVARLYGHNTDFTPTTEGVLVSTLEAPAEGVSYIDIGVYDLGFSISIIGENTEYLNGYSVGSSGYRISGFLKMRGTIYNTNEVETFADFFKNNSGGNDSLLNILNMKYKWLKIPDDYNQKPTDDWVRSDDTLPIATGDLSSEVTGMLTFMTLEFTERKANGVIE